MKSIKFTEGQLSDMKKFYAADLEKTLERLEHIKSILEKLGAEGQKIEIKIEKIQTAHVTKPASAKAKAKTAGRKKKKKEPRGIWIDFILKQLGNSGKPLTMNQLIENAIKEFNLPEEKHKNVRMTIPNSAFWLRKTHKKITTIPIKGTKEKLIALPEWVDKDGKLIKKYADKAEVKARSKPKKSKKTKKN